MQTSFPRPGAGILPQATEIRSGPGVPPRAAGVLGLEDCPGSSLPVLVPFLFGFLLDVLLVGDHLASKIGTRGRRKLIQKINTFLNLVF